jgi:hypothetical protein
MNTSLVLLLANLAWLLVVASKWGRKQFSYIVRLTVSITLFNIIFNEFATQLRVGEL